MGPSMSLILANIFLNTLQSSFFRKCPEHIKPSFYRRYLGDKFLLFNTEEQTHRFFQYVNNVHYNIKFTFETEIINRLSFLDVEITHDENQFITSVF